MTMDNVTFQTNNVVGNFNYPPNVPAYKPIMKFLLNCPLNKAFTNCSLVVYQNFLREFWSTVVAYGPFLSTDETEKRPLREFLIKFLVLNGQRPLTLDFNTFCSSTGLDYNNGKYVAHPTPKAVKKELGKFAINPSYLDKTLVLKNSFPVAWRILFTFVIQVDIGEIIYSSDYTQDEKFRFLPGILSNSNFTKDPSKVTNIELTAYMIAVNNQRDSVSSLPLSIKPKKGKSQTVTLTLPKSQGLEASRALSKKRQKPKSKKPPTKTKVTPPKPMEGSKQSHSVSSGTVLDPQDLERNIQLASMGLHLTLDEGTRKSQPLLESTTIDPKDLMGNKQPIDTGLPSMTSNEGTAKTTPLEPDTEPLQLQTFADVQAFLLSEYELDKESDKEEVLAAGRTWMRILKLLKKLELHHQSKTSMNHLITIDKSSTTIKDLYQGLNVITKLLKDINNSVKDDPATNKKIDDAIETFAKISTNTTEVLSLVKDFDFSTFQSTVKDLQAYALKQEEESAAWTKSSTNMAWNLGSRMTAIEISQTALKLPPTQAQPIATITTHPKSSQAAPRIEKEKGIATETYKDPSKKLVSASTIVRPDPDEEVKVPYMINRKMCYLTDTELQAYLDKEEKLWKAAEEARLIAISKPKVIIVVEKFKKAQDAEHQVLKREHSQKVKRLTELNKKSAEQYMWTMTSRIKPEPITDVKIHPSTKPDVLYVYRNNDKRNFDVHNPFKFTDFGITELDELGPIIQKKKNSIVKDLMKSLSKRYERLKKILKERRIQYALHTLVPKQASSQTLGRKRKHMELEPEVKVPGLECNQSLPKGVPFVNNMVIEEPGYGIFFTDVFGDHAF
ncbi:hypothetical protein Tco_0908966 [Tanacetum coccineum]|uniref:Retrovirus-related Pol polyprotein from transposon TNT 1-94 n=1 Tax=Tanacetum coccineum TaxID=301880 RepID=A0ABQ5CNN2_9ASTR